MNREEHRSDNRADGLTE